jgi:hypothetical protein
VLDGRELPGGRPSSNWAVLTTDLESGEHRLELPSHDAGPDPQSDYLYFASLIHEDRLGDYITLGD